MTARDDYRALARAANLQPTTLAATEADEALDEIDSLRDRIAILELETVTHPEDHS